MMLRRTSSLLFLTALLLIGSLTLIVRAQTTPTAQMRFVHVVAGAPPIDIYLDGSLAIAALGFGEASPYIAAPTGDVAITVTAEDTAEPLWQQTVNAQDDAALTLIASSSDSLAFTAFNENLNPLALGKARFTAVHAIPGAPQINVLLADGRAIVPQLGYNQPYGTLDLPALSYQLSVVRAGGETNEVLIPLASYALESGTSYMMLVYGTADTPEVMLLAAAVSSPNEEAGMVRAAHLVPGAPAVEVLLNDTLIVPALSFGDSTLFTHIPAGRYTAIARIPGQTEALAETEFALNGSTVLTLHIARVNGQLRLLTLPEDLSALNDLNGVFSLINIAGEGINASAGIQNGIGITGIVAPNGSSFDAVPAAADDISVSITQGGSTMSETLTTDIYGGVLYSVVVIAGDDTPQIVALPPAALAQAKNSAPFIRTLTVAASETPILALATATSEPQPIQTAVEPTPIPAANAPTARILLNPTANLHLRLYPDSQSFSLGLAPASATLIVQGREGAPLIIPGTPTEPFVDPAEGLTRNQDLNPAEVWLYVVYNTTDGGSVEAWVNAQFLAVTAPDGGTQRLASLPTIPRNRPGRSSSTVVQPPAGIDRTVTARTGNIADGTRVHIRRLPNIMAESLALVSGDTPLVLLGVNADRSWYYVRFTNADGTATGWISALYIVALERLGQSVTLERLQELNELNVLNGDERGGVERSIPPTSAFDPALRNQVVGEVINLNVGANLHLRRFDNSAAESLALLPVGTTMLVESRNEAGTWLRVIVENQRGWVSSQYIALTRNGRLYNVNDLPIFAAPVIVTPAPGVPLAPAGGGSGTNTGNSPTPDPTFISPFP
jgi:hypothetical protein